jgi:branched-chain amino acid transport system substrate-binding protein
MEKQRHWYRAACTVSAAALLAAGVLVTAYGGSSGAANRSSGLGGANTHSVGPKFKSGVVAIGDADYLSGSLALYGDYDRSYLEAAVDYVNAHGGVDGHKVVIDTADYGAAGATASSAAEQLIEEDNVKIIFGWTVGTNCAAAAPLATAHKVVLDCNSIPASSISPTEKYIFGNYPVESQEVAATLNFMKNYLKLPAGSTFATFIAEDAGAQAYAADATKAAEAAGYKLVDAEDVPLTSVDATANISNLTAAKPDFVIAEPVESFVQPLVESLRAAGNDATLLLSDATAGYDGIISVADPRLYQISSSEYVNSLNPPQAGAKLLVSALKMAGLHTLAKDNEVLGPEIFPGFYTALKAYSACGYSCTGTELAAQMQKTTITLPGIVSGTFGWTATNHLPYRQLYIYGYSPAKKVPIVVQQDIKIGSING